MTRAALPRRGGQLPGRLPRYTSILRTVKSLPACDQEPDVMVVTCPDASNGIGAAHLACPGVPAATVPCVTKENPGCWTHRRAFAQVRHGSNIQLLPYSLVAAT